MNEKLCPIHNRMMHFIHIENANKYYCSYPGCKEVHIEPYDIKEYYCSRCNSIYPIGTRCNCPSDHVPFFEKEVGRLNGLLDEIKEVYSNSFDGHDAWNNLMCEINVVLSKRTQNKDT